MERWASRKCCTAEHKICTGMGVASAGRCALLDPHHLMDGYHQSNKHYTELVAHCIPCCIGDGHACTGMVYCGGAGACQMVAGSGCLFCCCGAIDARQLLLDI